MHQYQFVKKKANIDVLNPFIISPTKKIINTQTNLQQKPTNCLIVFDHSVGLVLKDLQPVFAKLKPSHTFLIKMFKSTFKTTFLIKQRLLTAT